MNKLLSASALATGLTALAVSQITVEPTGFKVKAESIHKDSATTAAWGINDYLLHFDGDEYGSLSTKTSFTYQQGAGRNLKVRINTSKVHQEESRGVIQAMGIAKVEFRSSTLPMTSKTISVDLQDYRSWNLQVNVVSIGNDVAGGPITFLNGAITSSTGEWSGPVLPQAYLFPENGDMLDFGVSNISSAIGCRTEEVAEIPPQQQQSSTLVDSYTYTTTISSSEWSYNGSSYVVTRQVPTCSVRAFTSAQVEPPTASFRVDHSIDISQETYFGSVSESGIANMPNLCPEMPTTVRPIFYFWIWNEAGTTLYRKGVAEVPAGQAVPIKIDGLASGTYCVRLMSIGSAGRLVRMTISSGVATFANVAGDKSYFGDFFPDTLISTDDLLALYNFYPAVETPVDMSRVTDWFRVAGSPATAPMFCDVDRDGILTTNDYGIFSQNFDNGMIPCEE